MIFVTGDIHGSLDINKLSRRNNRTSGLFNNISKNDYVIICGDFGLIWNNSASDRWWLDWLEQKPFTTLFIDGNHENFNLLQSYPEEEFAGGKVHRISDSIFHLMRGYVFTLENKSFFAMGGAKSHDKYCRTPDKNWWTQELPSDKEYNNARKELEMHGYSVDYVLSHSLPSRYLSALGSGLETYYASPITDFFNEIEPELDYKCWFSGHYHRDSTIDLNPKIRLVYNDIIKL